MKRTAALVLSIALVVMGGTYADAKNSIKSDITDMLNGKDATVIIRNVKTEKEFVYNKYRSERRYTPESTYKVPHALIGLSTGAVRDEYEVKRWDGVMREFPDWNRDHTLASGMRYSVIWYYQAMARDIGEERMQENLDLLDYGNADISGGIDSFWLDSSLEISAREQTDFFEGLVEESFPFDKQQMRTVKRIMINDEQNDYTIHGKTGTRLSDYGLGWYTGYVETEKGEWVFAVNLDGSGTEAKNLTLEVLKKLNIIPKE
ncbi:class D beta-lactamase [Rossellomorea vietnamensis]|uniref:Beta-lactamase n=1 Tax=Rossellomorea vietnamensis TaxID=218284 RepID=A0A0P6VZK8_9BACI|nr:class D beta-lactamase [Rossellomorea vietnamensis]KPL58476.1 beta-lactamase [Rossellomorea vietnamensis]